MNRYGSKLPAKKPASSKSYSSYAKGGMAKGKDTPSWKGKYHYLKDGKEWKGSQHAMPNGVLNTGKTHTKTSQKLYHFKELNKTAQKKVMESK
jgi:hypothetical protein